MTQKQERTIVRWLQGLQEHEFVRQQGRYATHRKIVYTGADRKILDQIFANEIVRRHGPKRKNPCHENCGDEQTCVGCQHYQAKVMPYYIRCAVHRAVIQLHGAAHFKQWIMHPDWANSCSEWTPEGPGTGMRNPVLPGISLSKKDWYVIRSLKPGQIYQAYDTKGKQWDFKRLWGAELRFRVYTDGRIAGEATLAPVKRGNPLNDGEAQELVDRAHEHVAGAREHKDPSAATFDYGVASGIGEAVTLAGPDWAKRKLQGGGFPARRLGNPPRRITAKDLGRTLADKIESGEEIPRAETRYLDKGRYQFGGRPWRSAIKGMRESSMLGRARKGLMRWPGHPLINPLIEIEVYEDSNQSGPFYTVYRNGRFAGHYLTEAEVKKAFTKLRDRAMKNPHAGTVQIGEHCLAVEYEDVGKAKREGVANPQRPWRHDFKKTGAAVFGLPDGSVLIKGPHPLWRSQKNSVTGE